MNQTNYPTRCRCQHDRLALRMIRHGARSSTVSAWTGLSANRIRTLGKQEAITPQVHHRGQRPRRVAYFFRTPLVVLHAAVLGSHFELLEVLSQPPAENPAQNFCTFARGEKLCLAYEMYCADVGSPLLQFEHAVLLATALAEGKEISMQPCPECGGVMLVDQFAPAADACTHCDPNACLAVIAEMKARAAARALQPSTSRSPVDGASLERPGAAFFPETDKSSPAVLAEGGPKPEAASQDFYSM